MISPQAKIFSVPPSPSSLAHFDPSRGAQSHKQAHSKQINELLLKEVISMLRSREEKRKGYSINWNGEKTTWSNHYRQALDSQLASASIGSHNQSHSNEKKQYKSAQKCPSLIDKRLQHHKGTINAQSLQQIGHSESPKLSQYRQRSRALDQMIQISRNRIKKQQIIHSSPRSSRQGLEHPKMKQSTEGVIKSRKERLMKPRTLSDATRSYKNQSSVSKCRSRKLPSIRHLSVQEQNMADSFDEQSVLYSQSHTESNASFQLPKWKSIYTEVLLIGKYSEERNSGQNRISPGLSPTKEDDKTKIKNSPGALNSPAALKSDNKKQLQSPLTNPRLNSNHSGEQDNVQFQSAQHRIEVSPGLHPFQRSRLSRWATTIGKRDTKWKFHPDNKE